MIQEKTNAANLPSHLTSSPLISSNHPPYFPISLSLTKYTRRKAQKNSSLNSIRSIVQYSAIQSVQCNTRLVVGKAPVPNAGFLFPVRPSNRAMIFICFFVTGRIQRRASLEMAGRPLGSVEVWREVVYRMYGGDSRISRTAIQARIQIQGSWW